MACERSGEQGSYGVPPLPHLHHPVPLGHAHLVEDFAARVRYDRLERDGHPPDGVDEDVEDGLHAGEVGLLQFPGLLHVYVGVEVADEGEEVTDIVVDLGREEVREGCV